MKQIFCQGVPSLSSFPQNHFEPVQDIIPDPAREQWDDHAIAPVRPVAPQKPASVSHAFHTAKKKIRRQLTPAKLGVAWEKVRHVVRDMCKQRGSACRLCRLYGGEIEFQLSDEYRPVVLKHEGDRIIARISKKRWTIRVVRIKTGGSAYEFRRKRLTATRLVIEILHEALDCMEPRNTGGLP